MATTAQDVRLIALSLPDSTEKPAWGMPTFRVGGKIFVSLADDDTSIGVKCPKEERAELIAAEPEKFFVRAGHDDNYAWIRVRLAALRNAEELHHPDRLLAPGGPETPDRRTSGTDRPRRLSGRNRPIRSRIGHGSRKERGAALSVALPRPCCPAPSSSPAVS